MNTSTYFNAYKRANYRILFIACQQGGDYSREHKKRMRQRAKLDRKLDLLIRSNDIRNNLRINNAWRFCPKCGYDLNNPFYKY